MTRIQKKILLFVFIILSLWRLFQIPAVSNAFWTFCTLGILPGTNSVVPPNLVLKFLVMAFPFCLLLIFKQEFLAAVPRRRSLALGVVESPASPKPKSRIVIRLPLKVRVPFRARIARLDRATGVLMGYAARLSVRAMQGLVHLARVGGRYTIKVAIFEAQAMVHLWQLTEPSIRRFDHWLNVTLHKSQIISRLLELGGELTQTISRGIQRAHTFTYRHTQHKP